MVGLRFSAGGHPSTRPPLAPPPRDRRWRAIGAKTRGSPSQTVASVVGARYRPDMPRSDRPGRLAPLSDVSGVTLPGSVDRSPRSDRAPGREGHGLEHLIEKVRALDGV